MCLDNVQTSERPNESDSDFYISRDLRMLLKSSAALSKARHPAIMPRPSSKCFILEMENIKLLCFSEKCLIINPEERATQNFIKGLKEQFKSTKHELSKTNEESGIDVLVFLFQSPRKIMYTIKS